MWSTIKSILQNKTDKCLIIENGEPKYVLLTFEEYQHLQKGQGHSIVEERAGKNGASGEVNAELQDMAMDIEEESEDSLYETAKEETSPRTIKIEDLPF